MYDKKWLSKFLHRKPISKYWYMIQVPLYFMPCLILFHDRPGSFQLIPLRRVELLKYPHYKRFSGDLEVSSNISVSWEKSNFNTNLWNDRVQCISTKWCKKEHVLYIYLYTAICWIYMYMSNTRFSYNYMLNIRFTCVAKWIVYFCYLV